MQSELQTLGRQPGQVPANRLLCRIGSGDLLSSVAPARRGPWALTGRNEPARAGMLDLLRDAFNHNWTVIIDYNIDPGKTNGVIIRTALTR